MEAALGATLAASPDGDLQDLTRRLRLQAVRGGECGAAVLMLRLQGRCHGSIHFAPNKLDFGAQPALKFAASSGGNIGGGGGGSSSSSAGWPSPSADAVALGIGPATLSLALQNSSVTMQEVSVESVKPAACFSVNKTQWTLMPGTCSQQQ